MTDRLLATGALPASGRYRAPVPDAGNSRLDAPPPFRAARIMSRARSATACPALREDRAARDDGAVRRQGLPKP